MSPPPLWIIVFWKYWFLKFYPLINDDCFPSCFSSCLNSNHPSHSYPWKNLIYNRDSTTYIVLAVICYKICMSVLKVYRVKAIVIFMEFPIQESDQSDHSEPRKQPKMWWKTHLFKITARNWIMFWMFSQYWVIGSNWFLFMSDQRLIVCYYLFSFSVIVTRNTGSGTDFPLLVSLRWQFTSLFSPSRSRTPHDFYKKKGKKSFEF